MLGRRMCKELHKEIKLEVDGKHVELPPIEGIIILNIMRWVRVSRSKIFFSMIYFPGSWGSGANIWGPEKDEKFTKPNHWDGMLEVVGVQGQLRPHKHNLFTANKIFYCDPTATLHLRSKEINLNAILGVVHLGQIQSGLRAAIRIVQGSHIKIHMNSDVPVQVPHYFYLMTSHYHFVFP